MNLLIFGCLGRRFRIWTSAAMDSVIASSCDLSIILTAYSTPVSLAIHLLTVLESPLNIEGDNANNNNNIYAVTLIPLIDYLHHR